MARPRYDTPLVLKIYRGVNFQTLAIPRGKKKKNPIGNSIRAFFRGKKNLHKSPYVEEKKKVTCRHI
jgi:hypothetical protein